MLHESLSLQIQNCQFLKKKLKNSNLAVPTVDIWLVLMCVVLDNVQYGGQGDQI